MMAKFKNRIHNHPMMEKKLRLAINKAKSSNQDG